MLDISKEITDLWYKHMSIVVVEETGKIYFYNDETHGLYKEMKDIRIKNGIKIWIDETNKEEINNKEWKPVVFTTTLFNQVKNNLHGRIEPLSAFDKKEWRINCKNGYIDMLYGGFQEHVDFDKTPYLSFIQIPVWYDEKAKCPTINKFIIDVFGADRLAFIYEIIGYLLYRTNKFQKAFIFFGEASSGKTTFIELLRVFLGEKNIQDISIQKINQRFQMAQLRSRLANIYDDLPIQKLNYIMNFKQVVTNKTLTGEIKGVQDLVTWNNFCKQVYTTNNLPEVHETTGDDFWRRIILIQCTNFFDNGNKDFDIGEKLEKELSGLLNMALFHFKNLIERKHFMERFDNIDTVKGIWLINVSPLKLFLDTHCTLIETEEEECEYFRTQVNAFRKESNALPISMNLITRRLKDLGVKKKQKSDGNRYYFGVKVNTPLIEIQLKNNEMILDEF